VRLLVVSNLYPPAVLGGYEVECQVVVDALRARGDDVTVLTGDRDAATTPREPGVRRDLTFLTSDPRGSLRAPAAALRGAETMRRTLEELRPDLVWIWNGAQLPQAALVTALRSPFPVAFRVCEAWFGELWRTDQFLRHLYGTDTGLRRAWALALRSLNRHPSLRVDVHERHSAHVVWNSRALMDHAGVPEVIEALTQQVLHTTAARGPLFAAAQRRAPNPLEPPVIAFVGRANAAKGVDVAVDAVIELKRRHGIAATLALAGAAEPRDRSAMNARVAAAGMPPGTLRWLGIVDPSEVVELFETAAATVVVSVAFDAFPQVCIEAALARVPVVGSDAGGIPECLLPDEHALIVPRGDAGATASALAQVITDPEATAARVERARLRADDFDLGRYLEASMTYVDELAAASRRTE
jgi:glycogen synthase